MPGNIAVIIPAFRAGWCIGDAVASALAQQETAEVIVVDDASGDDTLEVAKQADDGSGRLKLIQQDQNQGPSAARNRAIAESMAPIIALLDSDDQFLPGRFTSLLAIEKEWDFVADNILFVGDARELVNAPVLRTTAAPRTRRVGMREFVRRNISKRGANRSELGFLKPLMKRDFLERHGLRYDEDLRLGEDFVLYTQALAKGARFRLAETCGYGAVEREGSLSGHHSAADLAALADASRAVMNELERGQRRDIMAQHVASIEEKVAHRNFLDCKRSSGLSAALQELIRSPHEFLKVSRNVALDKFAPVGPSPLPRRLFSSEEFERA